MPAVIERRLSAGPDVQERLAASKAGAEFMQIRSIRCPSCGFYLLDVYGHDHYFLRVKCRKCKFDETIDTALFRTMNRKQQKRLQAYSEAIGRMMKR